MPINPLLRELADSIEMKKELCKDESHEQSVVDIVEFPDEEVRHEDEDEGFLEDFEQEWYQDDDQDREDHDDESYEENPDKDKEDEERNYPEKLSRN